ncbi:MFS transporter [Nonomuraea sp. bgisy101]|uniref:MFS transporter n=1 Tax=Nonomuraea sp. bgisy101 TaxID=3413784 RepID=UPI003D7154CB
MIETLRQFRSFETPIKLVQVNQAGINLGFYMLMPYLAQHLATGVGLAAWTIGLVLGLRNLSQQGLFLIGGTLADRLGCKRVIMAGCALRTLGFVLFGLSAALPVLLVAAAVTGFAGALFNPAARAYLAREAGDRKVAAFAVFNVFYQGGILLGPLLGIVLLNGGFTVVCLSAAAIFAVLTVLQGIYLPERRDTATPDRSPVCREWRQAFDDRAFLAFAAAMIASYGLSFQMYLGLPLEVQRAGGGDGWVAVLYALSAVLGIAGQVRLTAWCSRRWTRGRAMSIGLALMGVSFVPMAVAAHLSPPWPWAILPALACTLVLTAGTLVAYPFEMATIADMAGDRLVGTYYGLYNLLSGVGILAGYLVFGSVMDLTASTAWASVPWVVLVAAGLASATAVRRLTNRDRLIAGQATAAAT